MERLFSIPKERYVSWSARVLHHVCENTSNLVNECILDSPILNIQSSPILSNSWFSFMLLYCMKMRGLSKIAGYTGVAQTAVTRCMLVPCACMLLPSMLMGMMKKRRMLPTSKAALTAIELTVIYGSLQLAMPAALAVFPQVSIRHKYSQVSIQCKRARHLLHWYEIYTSSSEWD